MRGPGRPAGPAEDTTAVVLTAALQLLLDEGAAALTPQRLHAATGVSRSTVYRHWPTPHAVLEALIEVAPSPELALSGDVRADLRAAVESLCERLRTKPVAAFLQALLSASAADPEAASLRTRYVEDLYAPFRRAAAGLPARRREEVVASVVAPLLVDALLLERAPRRAAALRAIEHADLP